MLLASMRKHSSEITRDTEAKYGGRWILPVSAPNMGVQGADSRLSCGYIPSKVSIKVQQDARPSQAELHFASDIFTNTRHLAHDEALSCVVLLGAGVHEFDDNFLETARHTTPALT
nr:hypothetical protein CFP56_02676 [Quercus suber]